MGKGGAGSGSGAKSNSFLCLFGAVDACFGFFGRPTTGIFFDNAALATKRGSGDSSLNFTPNLSMNSKRDPM